MNAVRTWKRDGSTNTMTLDAAALNLIRWHRHYPDYNESLAHLRKRLAAGETIETPWASFRLEGVGRVAS